MKEKKFGKLINEIQTFMGLDNWQINYDFEKLDSNINAQCKKILYSYFSTYIEFSDEYIETGTDDEIIHTIFHELSHLYTSQSLVLYKSEEGYFTDYIGKIPFVELLEKMQILNEQQTEFLARRFKELYLKSK